MNPQKIKSIVLIIGSVGVLVVYIIYGIMDKLESKVLSFLFFGFQLLAAYYLSTEFAKIGWNHESLSKQKKIASTAIRHLRENLRHILFLEKLSSERIAELKDEKSKLFIREIIGHIRIFYNNIYLSQTDFKEIVTEELELESEILKRLQPIVADLDKVKSEVASKVDQKDIQAIDNEYQQKFSELEREVQLLPFGPTGPTGIPTGSIEMMGNYPPVPGPVGPSDNLSIDDTYFEPLSSKNKDKPEKD